jgi:thioredoxin reductase
MLYDVVIAGAGPAGLSAALTLGRARKSVLLCDAGPRRNAAADHVHGFVTRDGITPTEFRRIGRQQLEPYNNVETREVRVEEIRGEHGAFEVRLATGGVEARRILLCTGLIDELPGLDGFRALWGTSIFQCPYCHGWEVQDRRFAYLAQSAEMLDFALLLRGWTSDVVALTDGRYSLPPEAQTRLTRAGVRIEERRIQRLSASGDRLEHIEFVDGSVLRLNVLFAHPPQRQVEMVRSLDLALDSAGLVQVDEMDRETSRQGIYAGGDLITHVQGAIVAAASGMHAAARLNHALTAELAANAALP